MAEKNTLELTTLELLTLNDAMCDIFTDEEIKENEIEVI